MSQSCVFDFKLAKAEFRDGVLDAEISVSHYPRRLGDMRMLAKFVPKTCFGAKSTAAAAAFVSLL